MAYIDELKITKKRDVFAIYGDVLPKLSSRLSRAIPLSRRETETSEFRALCSLLAVPSRSIPDWGDDKPVWFRLASNLRDTNTTTTQQVVGNVAALLLHNPTVPTAMAVGYSPHIARRNCRLAAIAMLQCVAPEATQSIVNLTTAYSYVNLMRSFQRGQDRAAQFLQSKNVPLTAQDLLTIPRWGQTAHALAATLGYYEVYGANLTAALKVATLPRSKPIMYAPEMVSNNFSLDSLSWPK
jgi:hypothetical protein